MAKLQLGPASSDEFLNVFQWKEWHEFVGNFFNSFRQHAPEDIKDFIGNLLAQHREHAPDDIKEVVDHLTEFLGHHAPVAPVHFHEFDPPIDEGAGTLRFASPDVSFFEMAGPGFGAEFEIDEQVSAKLLPDELTENSKGFLLDKKSTIDPVDVKEFIGSLIEPFRAHAPDNVKEFFGNLTESLRRHAPDNIKEFVDRSLESLGHHEQSTTAQSYVYDTANGGVENHDTTGTAGHGKDAPVGTYDEMADFLVNGFWEWFDSVPQSWAKTDLTVNLKGMPSQDQTLGVMALALWADVTPFTFTRASGVTDITFSNTDGDPSTTKAFSHNELLGNTITSSTITIESSATFGLLPM